jgi:hypothetical protein
VSHNIAVSIKPKIMDSNIVALINKAYIAFNSRDLDTALSTFHTEVDWPKAFEGGYIKGREAVKDYWIRQSAEIDAIVKPVSITLRDNGTYEVNIHQVVKDIEGKILFDGMIKHIYSIQDDLLRRMDIEIE